jgi:hypothetical protein
LSRHSPVPCLGGSSSVASKHHLTLRCKYLSARNPEGPGQSMAPEIGAAGMKVSGKPLWRGRKGPPRQREIRNACSRPSVCRPIRGNRAYCCGRQRAAAEYGASQLWAGAGYRAGVGWRRFGRALGGFWRPSNSRSHSPMERPMGATALGAEPLLWRVGSLWRAGGPNVLGVGSQSRGLPSLYGSRCTKALYRAVLRWTIRMILRSPFSRQRVTTFSYCCTHASPIACRNGRRTRRKFYTLQSKRGPAFAT